jgi:hypothetical protein
VFSFAAGDVHVMEEEILQFYRIGAAAAAGADGTAAATTAALTEEP